MKNHVCLVVIRVDEGYLGKVTDQQVGARRAVFYAADISDLESVDGFHMVEFKSVDPGELFEADTHLESNWMHRHGSWNLEQNFAVLQTLF